MYNIYKHPILINRMIGGADIPAMQTPERDYDDLAENIANYLNTEDLRNLRQVSRANRALANQPRVIQRAEYNHWMEQVQINGNNLRNAPETIRNNPEIVLAAIRQSGVICMRMLPTASLPPPQVHQRARAFQYASQELRSNREFILAAVKVNGLVLLYLNGTQINGVQINGNDREIVLAAVRQNGLALRNVLEPLRNDREITLAAVRQNGMALDLVSNILLNDKEIVLAAVRQNGLALQYILPSVLAPLGIQPQLINDREIAIAAVNNNYNAMQYLSQEMRRQVRSVVPPEVAVEPAATAGSGAYLRDWIGCQII